MLTVTGFLFTHGGVLYALAAALLFMLPLRRRSGFIWRFPVSATAAFLVSLPVSSMRDGLPRLLFGTQADSVSRSLFWLIPFNAAILCSMLLLLAAVFWFCCRLPLSQIVYGAACALITENLSFALFLTFFPQASRLAAGAASVRPVYFLIDLAIHAAVYALVYFRLAVRLPREREYRFRCAPLAALLFLLHILTRTLFVYARQFYGAELLRLMLITVEALYAALLASQLLVAQKRRWQESSAVEGRLRDAQRQEYQRLLDSSETIKRLGHELKHLLAALPEGGGERLEALNREIRASIGPLEAHTETGNGTLDALLSIAWQRCRNNGVEWTCTADGSALRQVDPLDLYMLLGNAMDNAIEAAAQMEEPDKRCLALSIRQHGGCALIKLTNYCSQTPRFRGGLPVTTKPDAQNHGYGTRCIRDIAERYGGEARFSAKDQLFSLDIILPAQ